MIELFIEGSNGGKTTKVKAGRPWRCFEYDGSLPPITIGTKHGAIQIALGEDERSVQVRLSRWKLGNNDDAQGVDKVLYEGRIDG